MVMFENFIVFLNDILWGPPMIVLLTGTHLWITWKTGFMQKYIFKGIKLSVTKDPDAEGEISSFAALTTALASTIGTGNIIGFGRGLWVFLGLRQNMQKALSPSNIVKKWMMVPTLVGQ